MRRLTQGLCNASAAILLASQPAVAATEHLLPRPQHIEQKEKALFRVKKDIRVSGKQDSMRLVNWCKGMELNPVNSKSAPRIEVIRVDSIAGALTQDEAYTLDIGKRKISLAAVTETGVIRALQTLSQLAEGNKKGQLKIENLNIRDWPAFRVRGFMHDTGRDFIPFEELKRNIDLLSRFKVNVFHFHLTENLGWRLQSKRFPKLNDASNFGRRPGQFYTLEQTRELENFCRERGVTLIPEIDMPGHSEAFTKTFGYDMQSAQGMNTLKELLREVCKEAFPQSVYLHIGTDEVVIRNAKFVPEMVAFVRGLGKKVMSWNPGAPYKKGEIDALQLWSSRGQFHPGIPCIDCRYHYLNHFDTYADVAGIYRSTVCDQQQGDPDHAGTILAVWNDRRLQTPADIIGQNGLYAAMLAIAERAWLGGGKAYITQGGVNLPPRGSEEFAEFADWERRFLYHKAHTLKGEKIPYVKQTDIRWRITDPFDNQGNPATVFPPEQQPFDTVYYHAGRQFRTHEASGAAVYLRHVWGRTILAFFADPKENSTAYAYTCVYSPEEQQAGVQLGFHDYGRSESDLPPQPGAWDYKGSRIWLNGRELAPPAWENVHTDRDNEIPLKNENFTARPPYQVTLRKGWNTVLLKLPVKAFGSRAIRLEKWMFTFVLTTLNGNEALPGLVYSPDYAMQQPANEADTETE